MFGAVPPTKLDAIIPPVADFPARHIGPRKHDARSVVQYLCIWWFIHIDEISFCNIKILTVHIKIFKFKRKM